MANLFNKYPYITDFHNSIILLSLIDLFKISPILLRSASFLFSFKQSLMY